MRFGSVAASVPCLPSANAWHFSHRTPSLLPVERPLSFAPHDGQAASPAPPNAMPRKMSPRMPGSRAIPIVIAPSAIVLKRTPESASAAMPASA